MKNLEKSKLQSLLEIMGSNPSLQIAHFAQESSVLTQMLYEYCNQRDYLYQINCPDAKSYEELSATFRDEKEVHIKNFSLERKSYMMQGRQFDFVFVTMPIEAEIKSEFLRKVYGVISNSGNIIIFVGKQKRSECYELCTLLEEHNYVATNTIADLCDHYDVVISKKMHGWGSL